MLLNAPPTSPRFLALCAAGIVLAACDSTNSGAGSPMGPASSGPLVIVTTGRYTVAGNSITLVPDEIEDEAYCAEEHLSSGEIRHELRRDTNRTTTVSWSIVGDTLRFPIEKDTSRSYGTPTTIFGITEHWISSVRIGGGPGIEGVWRAVGVGEREIFGNGGSGSGESEAYSRQALALAENTFSFADGRITITGKHFAARWFLAQWNGDLTDSMGWPGFADSARHDIAVEILDERRVRLTGRTSGEVVTIAWTESEETYTSSVAAHSRHVYYRNPSACPNEPKPGWWQDFLVANRPSNLQVTWGVKDVGASSREGSALQGLRGRMMGARASWSD